MQAILRAVWPPCPRISTREDIARAAAAIDRLNAVATSVIAATRAATLDDLTEKR